MWDTPEVLVAALHDVCSELLVDTNHSDGGVTWSSVLSSASVLTGGQYTRVVHDLFMAPFKSRDAFQMQKALAEKLKEDMEFMQEDALPYAQDNEAGSLKRVSMELDEVLSFLGAEAEYTSRFYDWENILVGLKSVTHDAIEINSGAGFGYNGNPLQEGVLHSLSEQAVFVDLAKHPLECEFTPTETAYILTWSVFDLDYYDRLCSSPESALQRSVHTTDAEDSAPPHTQRRLGLRGHMEGLHTDPHTDGNFSDAARWVQDGAERFSKGVKKFRDDTAFSWKVSMLKHYNRVERSPGSKLNRSENRHKRELRWWMYNLKIAELAKADQDDPLTPEDRLEKQKEINDMKENWDIWSDDEMNERRAARAERAAQLEGAGYVR